MRVLQAALAARSGTSAAPEELARLFTHARTDRVADLLETFADLGQTRKMDGEKNLKGM